MDNGYRGGLIVLKTAEFCYGKNWTLVFLIAMSRINQVFFVELRLKKIFGNIYCD